MLKHILKISLLLITPYITIYAAHPGPQHIDMCLTDTQYPSSPVLRKWAFHILQCSGYPNPHEVKIINASSTPSKADPLIHQACAHAFSKTIHFNERYFAGHPIGVKLATIGHEAIHLRQNDDPKEFQFPQQHERYADTEGLRLGACEKCGIEIAHYYAEEQKKETKNIPQLFAHPAMPKNIQEFSMTTESQKTEFISLAQKTSEKHYTTHPCGLERAFYLHALSQTSTLKGKLCQFHLKNEQKRKVVVRKILQEAQQRKKTSGTKRSHDENETLPADETPATKKDKQG